MPSKLGQFIDARMKILGIGSATELAERVGVSRKTIYQWKDDASHIRVDNLIRLARALEVHPLHVLRLVTAQVISSPVTSVPRTRLDDAGFVDETVPDGTLVGSAATFRKSWFVQNLGSVAWTERRLVCQDDNELLYVLRDGVPVPFHSCVLEPHTREIAVPAADSGEVVELSVEFTAPLLPGRATSIWKLTDLDGNLLYPGKPGLWCQVVITGFY